MPRRISLGLAAVLLLILAPATADAGTPTSVSGLSLLSVSSPPQRLAPSQRFVVTGRMRNTGGRASTPLLSFRLRTRTGAPVYAMASSRLDPLRKGYTRTYRARLRLPSNVRAGTYTFQACVKRSRTGRTVCRSARRTVRVTAPPLAPAPVVPPVAPAAPAPAPAPAPAEPAPVPPVYADGARTLNDPLFPDIGNGGYDAQSYALDLAYEPGSFALGGTATITAEATQNLSGFSFDLAPWNVVSAVTVDGVPADFSQSGEKLDVVPTGLIADGATFTTEVTYAGTQQDYVDPDGSSEGFLASSEGALVMSEPVGAQGWFPSNNVPYDNATWEVGVSVPAGEDWDVIGPGLATPPVTAGGRTRFVWTETAPTSTYLVGLAIGKYDITTSTQNGRPFTNAVASAFTTSKQAMKDDLDLVPSMEQYFADYFDVPYPFSSHGGIVGIEDVGYALETQSKPIYAIASAGSNGPSRETIAHETAHQWFGNHTTLTSWDDIWLNEGPAEYLGWMWSADEDGGTALQTRWNQIYAAGASFWTTPPAAPTVTQIFSSPIYNRGAATIHGMRVVLGEATFRAVLKEHLTASGHAFGTATTESLIATVKAADPSRAARWDEYFRQWLYQPSKPTMTPANFDTFVLP